MLFFELARVVEAKKPAYLFLENVPGLLSHDHGETYLTILRTLSGLGYICEWQTLHSSDFDVPQGRKRLYIIGYRDERCAGKIFPFTESHGSALVPSAERGQQNLTASFKIKGDTKTGFVEAYPGDSISLGFLCNEKKHGRVKRGQAHTLTTRNNEAVVTVDGRIRHLLPQEYLRLQGLHEDQIAKVMAVNSESQIYKQAGNGVTIPVIKAIGRRICEMDQDRRCGNH